MKNSNISLFLGIIEKATGISDKDEIKRKFKEKEIGDLLQKMENRNYKLRGNEENFLRRYKNDIEAHEDSVKKIAQIENNYTEIENIYDTLESEIEKALDESVELEKISKALGDKKLIKKAKIDESKINEIKAKLEHFISMKEEMESLESRLEAETKHFKDIENASNRRITLIEKLLFESRDSSSGSSYRTTYSALADMNSKWEDLRDDIENNGSKLPNGVWEMSISDSSGTVTEVYEYIPESSSKNGNASWLWIKRPPGVVNPSNVGKIHYRHHDAKTVAQMASIAERYLKNKSIDHEFKVDIDSRYSPGSPYDYMDPTPVLIIYAPVGNIEDISDELDKLRKKTGLPNTEDYKERESGDYSKYKGFSLKYSN